MHSTRWLRIISLVLTAWLSSACGGGTVPVDEPQNGGDGAPLIKSIAPLTWPARSEAQFSAVVEGDTPMSLQWDFGEAANPAASTDAAPLVTWQEVGDFEVQLTASNALGKDTYTYTMHSIGYVVSGRVVTYGGEGLEGVSIYFDNELEPVVTSDDGFWWRDDLASGDYQITPGRVDWEFDPPNRKVTIESTEINGLWFTFTGCKRTEESWLRTWTSYYAGDVVDVNVDATGQVYVAGSAASVLKYDSSGELLWAKAWEAEHEYAYDYRNSADAMNQSAAGNLYIGGYYNASDENSGYCLVKLNSSGELNWLKQLDKFHVTEMKATDNSVYLAGTWYDSDSSVNRPGVLQLSGSGEFQDCYTFQIPGTSSISKLALDAAGNIYLAGNSQFGTSERSAFIISIDEFYGLNWGLIWEGWYKNSVGDLAVDEAGNILLAVVGEEEDYYADDIAAFIKFSSTGVKHWQYAWLQDDYSWYSSSSSSVAWCQDNQAILGWRMQPAPGSDYVRYGLYTCDSEGNLGELRSLTHPERISVDSLCVGPSGEVILTGEAANSSAYWESTVIEQAEIDGVLTNLEVTMEPHTISVEDVAGYTRDISGVEDSGTSYYDSYDETIMVAKRMLGD